MKIQVQMIMSGFDGDNQHLFFLFYPPTVFLEAIFYMVIRISNCLVWDIKPDKTPLGSSVCSLASYSDKTSF